MEGEADNMAGKTFTPGMDGGAAFGGAPGDAAGDNTFFESVKTSLPGLGKFVNVFFFSQRFCLPQN